MKKTSEVYERGGRGRERGGMLNEKKGGKMKGSCIAPRHLTGKRFTLRDYNKKKHGEEPYRLTWGSRRREGGVDFDDRYPRSSHDEFLGKRRESPS